MKVVGRWVIAVLAVACAMALYAAPGPEQEIAGELFGAPVPLGNYYFAKRVVLSYGAKWRGTPQDNQELEDLVWRELVFSYEAFQRGISVSESEIDKEIDALTAENKVPFRWRVDREAFQQWTQETMKVPVEVFRNQMRHLVQLEKLREQVIASFSPEVTDAEAYQKFLNEYNTLSVELVEFPDRESAVEFYEQVKVPPPADALDELVWRDAVRSFFAAKERNVSEEEFASGMGKLLAGHLLTFNWTNDETAFAAWVAQTTGYSLEVFRDSIRKLLAVDAEIQARYAAGRPDAADEPVFAALRRKAGSAAEAYRRFLRQNPRGAYLRFADFDAAKRFYQAIQRTAGRWDDWRRREPKRFKRPGFVAMDFLIHLWGFRQADADAMSALPIGSIYPPAPIYKGFGVFNVLAVRSADAAAFTGQQEAYRQKVRQIKQYEQYRRWADDLVNRARVQRLIAE
ncbi:MAG: hypothetical protein NC924_10245 [Candidatus Omnitrophica bacterium]|nr:hypothetical protein [Candidatus Omnitrophota bacterium]